MDGELESSPRNTDLFNFAMNGVTAKEAIELLLFHSIRLCLLIPTRHITGNRFPLSTCLGTFQDDVISCHN